MNKCVLFPGKDRQAEYVKCGFFKRLVLHRQDER